jgi:hypothetical protein
MTKQKAASNASEGSSSNKGISDLIQYYRITTAAELLACTAEELLHLGALGKLEITAPVVAAGEFTWPTGAAKVAFIEIDSPFVHYFDASSRVALFPHDLAKIEALGGTLPWRFYAPTYSRRTIENAPRSFEIALAERNARRLEKNQQVDRWLADLRKTIPDGNVSSDSDSGPRFPMMGPEDTFLDDGLIQLREAGFYTAWVQVGDPAADSPKTTLEHLFISKAEVDRIRQDLPQENPLPTSELGQNEPKRPHGGVERHSKVRLEALQVAIWVHRKAIKDVVGNASKWARMVEAQSNFGWPPGSVLQLEHKALAQLLQRVLREDWTDMFTPLK